MPKFCNRFDMCIRQNVACGDPGVSTSPDMVEESEAVYELASGEGRSSRVREGQSDAVSSSGVARNEDGEQYRSDQSQVPKDLRQVPAGRHSREEVRTSACLKTVCRIWGGEKVEYYQWVHRGEHYCNKVRTAALVVMDWDEAVLKLNRLIHRRARLFGRFKVKESANPIDCCDLINLKAWSHKDPYVAKEDKEGIVLPFTKLAVTELPAGYGFDKFGLMVRSERQSSDNAAKGGLMERREQQQSGNRTKGGAAVKSVVSRPSRQHQETRKRNRSVENSRSGSKCARTAGRWEGGEEGKMEELASVLQSLDEEFDEKERLSQGGNWCRPIPLERKVSTVWEFYKAFHDTNTLPIHTCVICYRKFATVELQDVSWDRWTACLAEARVISPFRCRRCFPVAENIRACGECMRYLGRGVLSPAAHLHIRLGCEHMFPNELKGLTVVEEKLIALNSCYGLITKYSVPDGRRQSVRYPKHVKGHIKLKL